MSKRITVPWQEQLAMQQIISKTVDLVTNCANNDDPENNPLPTAELREHVYACYHEKYEFRVIHLDTGKDRETFDRDGFIAYHAGVHKYIYSVDRMCGAMTLISHTADDAQGPETCLFRNMVWSTMFRRNDPETRIINFARMRWIFVRDDSKEWKLSIWDDAIQFVNL